MLDSPDQTALRAAFDALLKPLARLALSRGLPYTAMDELLRAALVNEAILLNANTPAHGMVSRVSTATGLNRREVGRLLAAAAGDGGAAAQRWLSGELFARWMTDPDYLQAGKPLRLARQGAAPSFESLAQSITRDVHPRALLEELCRLGLAQWNAQDDTVGLQRDAFVPRADFTRMVALLADNVGDHLHAAVDNVLGDGEAHFDHRAMDTDVWLPDSCIGATHCRRPGRRAATRPARTHWAVFVQPGHDPHGASRSRCARRAASAFAPIGIACGWECRQPPAHTRPGSRLTPTATTAP